MESRTGIRDHPLIQPLDQAVLAIFWDPIFMDVQLFVPTSEKISHSHLMLLVSHGWFQIVDFVVDCSTPPGFSGGSHGRR